MKRTILLLLAGWFSLLQIIAQPTYSAPRLAGILDIRGRKAAILEVTSSKPRGRWFSSKPRKRWLILGEREAQENIEVNQIDPEAGTAEVRVRPAKVTLTIRMRESDQTPPRGIPGLALADAGIDPVINIYAWIEGRTILRSPYLPTISLSLEVRTTNVVDVAKSLEGALAARGITSIPDGNKFLMLVLRSEVEAAKPHSSDIKTQSSAKGQERLVPAGDVNFVGVNATSVAGVYAKLIGCKLEPSRLSTLPITLRNETPLTRSEFVYALETLFRWQGLKVVQVGDHLAKLERILGGMWQPAPTSRNE